MYLILENTGNHLTKIIKTILTSAVLETLGNFITDITIVTKGYKQRSNGKRSKDQYSNCNCPFFLMVLIIFCFHGASKEKGKHPKRGYREAIKERSLRSTILVL